MAALCLRFISGGAGISAYESVVGAQERSEGVQAIEEAGRVLRAHEKLNNILALPECHQSARNLAHTYQTSSIHVFHMIGAIRTVSQARSQ